MADISQIKPTNGTTYNIKDKSAVANVSYNENTNIITITKRDGTSSTITLVGGDSSNIWVGTKTQYNAISLKDSETLYITTDEDTSTFIDSSTFSAHVNANNPHNITAAKINVYTKSEIDNKETALSSSISGVSGRVTTLEGNMENIPAIRYGTTDPDSSLGNNGDIYIKYTN